MTDVPTDPGADQGADAHQALIGLHDLAGAFGSVDMGSLPGFNFTPNDTALRVVAEAPKEEIPVFARVLASFTTWPTPTFPTTNPTKPSTGCSPHRWWTSTASTSTSSWTI